MQKKLIKETVTPSEALEIATHMELGAKKQQKVHQNLNECKTQWVNIVNNYQSCNPNVNFQKQRQNYNRNANAPNQNQNTNNCRICGQRWNFNHLQNSPAKGKNFNNCGIPNRFPKICRK